MPELPTITQLATALGFIIMILGGFVLLALLAWWPCRWLLRIHPIRTLIRQTRIVADVNKWRSFYLHHKKREARQQ